MSKICISKKTIYTLLVVGIICITTAILINNLFSQKITYKSRAEGYQKPRTELTQSNLFSETHKPCINCINSTKDKINVAVILINFQDTKKTRLYSSTADPRDYSNEEIKNILLEGENSIKNFFEENSYEKIKVEGNVFGWYTAPFNTNQCYTDHIKISDHINSAVRQDIKQKNEETGSDDNLDKYDIRLYLLAAEKECAGGWAYTHLKKAFFASVDPSGMVHEIGHVLGLSHGKSIFCGNFRKKETLRSIGDYPSCDEAEWGDSYEVMGDGFFHLNSVHKNYLGWFSENNVIKVEKSGIYEVHAIEQKTDLTQTLIIPKKDTNEHYFVEYRIKIGFDLKLPNEIAPGSLIHISRNQGGESILINPHVEKEQVQGNTQYASLKDGEKFVDESNNLRIEQIDHSENSARIRVSLGVIPDHRRQ